MKTFPELNNVFLSWLEDANNNLLVAGMSFVYKSFNTDNNWLTKVAPEIYNWNGNKILNFLLGLPFLGIAFDLLERQKDEIKNRYWENVRQYILLDEDIDRINYVVENLLNNNRPLEAVDAVGMIFYSNKSVTLDCELLNRVLLTIATTPTDKNKIPSL